MNFHRIIKRRLSEALLNKDCISFFTFFRIPFFSCLCVLIGFFWLREPLLNYGPTHFIFFLGCPVVLFSPFFIFYFYLFFFNVFNFFISKNKNTFDFDLRIKQ